MRPFYLQYCINRRSIAPSLWRHSKTEHGRMVDGQSPPAGRYVKPNRRFDIAKRPTSRHRRTDEENALLGQFQHFASPSRSSLDDRFWTLLFTADIPTFRLGCPVNFGPCDFLGSILSVRASYY